MMLTARGPSPEIRWRHEDSEKADEMVGTLVVTLSAFLARADEERLEWPLAKERRRHIHGRIDSAELPVRHETRRSGSPHTLIPTKTEASFERETAERRAEIKRRLDSIDRGEVELIPADDVIAEARRRVSG